MKTRWCLQSGPDRSHLHNYDWFDRLRDAKDAAASLPPTPNGEDRPFVIRRVQYKPVNRMFDEIAETIVINRAGPAYEQVAD